MKEVFRNMIKIFLYLVTGVVALGLGCFLFAFIGQWIIDLIGSHL